MKHNIQINQENNTKFTKMISALLIKIYDTTILFKILKPTEYKKMKRPHVYINVLIFTSLSPGIPYQGHIFGL